MEGEELMGWLVPEEKADEFKNIFENSEKIPDEWDDFYCWALWEDKGSIKIHFDSFNV